MGRLKRDRRMVGLFPSNFVQVLDESFQPGSRNPSPMPPHNALPREVSPNLAAPGPSPQKKKSVFRKPFQAYAAASSPNPEAAARELQTKAGSLTPTPSGSINRHKPFSSMKQPYQNSRSASPDVSPHGVSNLRAVSPAPSHRSRAPSPAPSVHYDPYINGHALPQIQHASLPPAPSPAPPIHHHSSVNGHSTHQVHHVSHSRAPSPQPYANHDSSPPPPAPPPHRVAYTMSRVPSPQPKWIEQYDAQRGINRSHTPLTQSPVRTNFTPSPLRDAMNDVMSSLQDMGMPTRSPSPESRHSIEIWSPDAFQEIHAAAAQKRRPMTSIGYEGAQATSHESEQDMYHSRSNGPPQVRDYVQRMESRLRRMQREDGSQSSAALSGNDGAFPPAPPPQSSMSRSRPASPDDERGFPSRKLSRRLRNRKSAYELGREVLGRTFTTKTNSTSASSAAQSSSTNSSSSTQVTSQSLMSGFSAGGFSATSAGSLARRKFGRVGSVRERPMSAFEPRNGDMLQHRNGRPDSPSTGVTYHSSHGSGQSNGSQPEWAAGISDSAGVLGGFATIKPKKSGFFKKMIESAKTGAATARSTIATSQVSKSPPKRNTLLPDGVTAISSSSAISSVSAARDMGLGGAVDWVQVRRDVNRSNSLSKNERIERFERCQMLDMPVFNPVDVLYQTAEGNEGLDGLPIADPTDFNLSNLSLVDKSARFIGSLPPMTNPVSLAQGYVCRPYRSDVQRLRAIFTWVSERIAWDEDFEGEIDSRRVIQTKRGCSEEIAVLVMEMCAAVGLHAEVVRGYLKAPGEVLDFDMLARPNHWWNAVIVDGEWRIMDCSLASPTNPRRGNYSNAGPHVAESWWFLAQPIEICYTHVPLLPEQQHICPPVPHEILMSLPCACPPFFRNGLQMADFDTSILNLENLELAHVHFFVPEDVECVAEVEVRTFTRDADGDFFESGDLVTKRGLAQAEWAGGRKRYTVKALLPGDEGQGVLKVYAGKRGLMVRDPAIVDMFVITNFSSAFYQIKSSLARLCLADIAHWSQPSVRIPRPPPYTARATSRSVRPPTTVLPSGHEQHLRLRRPPTSIRLYFFLLQPRDHSLSRTVSGPHRPSRLRNVHGQCFRIRLRLLRPIVKRLELILSRASQAG